MPISIFFTKGGTFLGISFTLWFPLSFNVMLDFSKNLSKLKDLPSDHREVDYNEAIKAFHPRNHILNN